MEITLADLEPLDLSPMFPDSLVHTGMDQSLRRRRVIAGKHRTWEILPRYGTANSDRWTVIGIPMPALSNPASAYEDGQYSDLESAYAAQARAEKEDNGWDEDE